MLSIPIFLNLVTGFFSIPLERIVSILLSIISPKAPSASLYSSEESFLLLSCNTNFVVSLSTSSISRIPFRVSVSFTSDYVVIVLPDIMNFVPPGFSSVHPSMSSLITRPDPPGRLDRLTVGGCMRV